MQSSFLCLFLFLSFCYGMKEESGKFEFNSSEIDFLEFLKKNYDNSAEETIVISLEDPEEKEAQAVIQFFDPYIKAFENHQYCSRKCVGEITNDDRADYVICTSVTNDQPSFESYSGLPPGAKKELFYPVAGDRICDSIKYRKEVKFFPVPQRDENGEHKSDLDECGSIINLYKENEYQQKLCYILNQKPTKVDHSTCKKEKCKNKDINKDYEQYDKTQPCALINEAITPGNKCCFVIENVGLYSLRLDDLSFFKCIGMIDANSHQEKDVIKIDILKIKQLGFFDKISEQKSLQKSFHFFMKKCLKPELLNKKNLGFGSLIGGLAYRFSSPHVKKRNAIVGGLIAYGGASLAFAYINRPKKKLISDEQSLKKKTELY